MVMINQVEIFQTRIGLINVEISELNNHKRIRNVIGISRISLIEDRWMGMGMG